MSSVMRLVFLQSFSSWTYF